ncbi:hypothetical protein SOVF_024790 [Spinacia oleracea]|uniref:DNA-directed RNA polymerase subunit n=1 Tax=Spinacia oleracea TaxID=3562 RepID=A0A9R0KC60_SPIOL|nr:uncharacterized protein LOC110804938 [Spinacia oleracea]KNA23433.1 hypothetical protein SOVF_024790 [Spinacia oleracea]
MEFCPSCANLLQYEMRMPARFFCRSCRYICPIEKKVKIKRGVILAHKEATPVVVGEKQHVGATTDATCPKCSHGKAEFEQMQTRSADEPMTIFYKCLNQSCKHNWRED